MLSLNAGAREDLAFARSTGSEVMGFLAPEYRLAPYACSLKSGWPNRLRHSLFHYCTYFNMSTRKSQMFFCQRICNFAPCFCHFAQKASFLHFFVDKLRVLWLNCLHKSSILMTLTEISLLQDTSESRWLVRTGVGGGMRSGSRVGLVNAFSQ